MIKKVTWILISCLMVLSLVLASCGQKEEEKEAKVTEEGETTVITTKGEEEEKVTSVLGEEEEEEVTTPAGTGNWWDKLGVPEYGGSFTISGRIPPTVDTYNAVNYGVAGFFDMLFIWDWTVNPETQYAFKTFVVPIKYCRGMLVDTWEWTDAQTLILNIRHDVYYQNKPPANGRKFTAHDIQYHYDRNMGTGSGFTEADINQGMFYFMRAIKKVTALDDYTVEVKYNLPSLLNNWLALATPGPQNEIENRETVEQHGPIVTDWEYAVGTGPFILADYLPGSTMTLEKNPNYWGHDERYPENQIPYVDKVKVLEIVDASTQMAAMRTAKIDYMGGVSWERAAELEKSNPKLLKAEMPTNAYAFELRVDNPPFTDIRVRKALNLAIDRETIAETYYNGTVDGNACGFLSPYTKGYCYDYKDWSQELKDEYSYNPEKAKELLTEAGYPNGFTTNVVAASGGESEDLLQILKAYFADINVDMELRLMEAGNFMNFVTTGQQDQMVFRNWWGMFAPVDIPMGVFKTPDPGRPITRGVSDPRYDALYEEWTAVSDEEEAMRISRECQKMVQEEHWSTVLFPLINYNIWQPYLKGYSGQLIFIFQQYWMWPRFWMDQNLKKSMGY
jgi:peptide/nickel transport system substrate-binding protein